MAVKCSFFDGVLYGTDDINDITRSLVGAGVSPFATKDVYNVSDLNAMISAVVEPGVQVGGCRCSIEGLGEAKLALKVDEGSVFFGSGVRLDVDFDGYSMIVEANSAGYVYAHFSSSLQKAEIMFGAEPLESGETVLLAYLSDKGELTDLRRIATSKIASFGRNVILKKSLKRMKEAVVHNGHYVVAKAEGVDVMRFNTAVLVTTNIYGDDDLKYYPEIGYYTCFFDITENKTDFVLYPKGDGASAGKRGYFYYSIYGDKYYVEVVGGELCVLCDCKESTWEKAVDTAFGCTVCFM